MPRYSVKCSGRGCNQHVKLNDLGRRIVREESERVGGPVGLLCPRCAVEAVGNDAEYNSEEIPLGEVVTMSAIEKYDRWHMVALTPHS